MKRATSMLLLMLGIAGIASAQEKAAKPFFSKSMVFGAHRGGSKWRPESTLKMFQESNRLWPHMMIETDSRVTKDGVAVLIHDKTVDRTTNGTGAVADLTLAEVQALDAGHGFSRDKGATHPYRGQGYQIPTVVEALRALPDKHFLIEIKDQPGGAEALVKAIQEADAVDRVCIASFNPEQMKIAEKLEPLLATCFDGDSRVRLAQALLSGNWDDYEPEDDLLIMNYHRLENYGVTEATLVKIQEKGIPVCLYNINEPEEMHHLLDLGIKSMLTDFPDRLAAVLEERAKR